METTLDGTTVTALLPTKVKSDGRSANGSKCSAPPRAGPDVNVVLAGKPRRRRDERSDGASERGRRPSDRRPGAERVSGDRATGRGRGGSGPPSDEGPGRRRTGPARPGARAATRRDGPRRLVPSSTFRNAALATLRPEQLPVAEQLLRGGIPAVRHAIEEQNGRARAEGRPEVTPGPLLALAEELLPR